MTLKLYTNIAERNRVDKSSYITLVSELTGTLRDATSLTNPSIVIESSTLPSCNYAYIPDFGRYYYIDEIVSVSKNLWQISMSVDVLMSYKGTDSDGIKSLNAYVIRQENLYNENLVDMFYPAQSNTSITYSTGSLFIANTWHGSKDFMQPETTDYRYLWRLAATMKDTTHTPATIIPTLYPLAIVVMNGDGARAVGQKIAQNTVDEGKSIVDYTLDFYALPCSLPVNTTTQPNKLDIVGIFNDFELPSSTGTQYFAPKSDTFKPKDVIFTAQFTTPANEKYKLFSPYTSLTVQFLPFGQFQLDPTIIWNAAVIPETTTIYFKVLVDPMSGNAALYYGNSYNDIRYYLGSANVSIQMPLSSTALNGTRIASGVITTAAGIASTIATEGAAAPAAVAAISGVINTASACLNPASTITGGEQKIIDDAPKVIIYHHAIPDTAPALYGRPYNHKADLHDLTGFTKVGDVHIEGAGFEAATTSELMMIKNELQAGVIL